VATVVGQVVVVLDVLVGAPLAGEDALDPDTEHEPPLIHHDVHARARDRVVRRETLDLPRTWREDMCRDCVAYGCVRKIKLAISPQNWRAQMYRKVIGFFTLGYASVWN
jgi:hypothetical protein